MANDSDIIWLASYPKSGNTWLKILLNQIISPKRNATESIPTFHKSFPDEAPLHELSEGSVKIVKTHCNPSNRRLSAGNGRCIGALTIYRHPLDVLLSAVNYIGYKQNTKYFKNNVIKSVEEILRDNEMDFYVDNFIENDGISVYSDMCGGWSTYQREWDERGEGIKYLRLCYEEMVRDPSSAVEALFDFVGVAWNRDAVDAVIAEANRRTARDGKFFWKKKAYNYREMLPAQMIARFCRAYETELSYLGYPLNR